MPPIPTAKPADWNARLGRCGLAALGAVLFCLPLFFWIGNHDQFELPKLTLLRLLTSAALGAWALGQALSKNWSWRKSPLDLPMLLWSLWLLAKTFHSVSTPLSWRGEYENFAGSLTQLNYSLLFWLSVQFVRSEKAAKALLLSFELSCAAVGAYAVFQALGLDFVAWSSSSVVQDRFFASMGNPNFLGALMIMGLALCIGRALERSEPGRRFLLWQGLFLLLLPFAWLGIYVFSGHAFRPEKVLAQGQKGALIVAGMYLAGLALWLAFFKLGKLRRALDLALLLEALLLFKALSDTGTRGALAGLIASLAFFAAFHMGKRSLPALGLLLGVLALASLALGPQMRSRMLETFRHPLQAFDASRLNIWMPALFMARERPLTGFGVDTFKTIFPQHSYSRFAHYDGDNVASRTAHCEPLQILATMGLVGLSLWFWLLFAWGRSWWLLRKAAAPSAWKSGLAALAVGYLVQNLVSFGVSAISAPFFLCLGLLWADAPLPEARRNAPAPKALWALLALLAAAWAAVAATSAFRADGLYNFGFLANSQAAMMEQAGFNECRGVARYVMDEMQALPAAPDSREAQEAELWLGALREGDSRPGGPTQAELPLYRHASRALLQVLSALKQERATRICPSEVKYRIYLGLAYEELYKLSAQPELRQHWFAEAEESYAKGSAMNPRNAYYHGNLARLYSLKAEEGDAAYPPKCEKEYLEAVRLAPSTRLFYENLILLYAQAGAPEKGMELLKGLEGRERDLAGQLYMGMAGTFYQASQAIKDKARSKALRDAAAAALGRAQELK